ncbi:hypothetical protein [Natronosalvus amylolyticus]|uniref:hypothetical protein n=1 Tax=Natronosalvus amylolyticus TaxID=2961994 RepID=UPI0020C96C2C|nr:hypothetical protein [Natronosalvus amylolyticus]
MNSDKAADVRDSINTLPCVAYDAEPSANYPGSDALTVTRRGEEWTHTGECVQLKQYSFRPAAIHQAGEIAFDGGDPRPCYEVVLEPLSIPFRPLPSISIPDAVVHEIAKHGCSMRVTAGLRSPFTPGTIRIRDDLAHDRTSDVDGDQCEQCGCTRFKIHDGVPQCERCGEQRDERVPDTTPKLEDYV